MRSVVQAIIENHWGELASVLGLAVSILGFGLTLFLVWRSKSAAQQAKLAADDARTEVVRSASLASFADALSTADELKRLIRARAWQAALDRHTYLRRALIEASNVSDLLDQDKATIQATLGHLLILESELEKTLAAKQAAPDIAKMNALLSRQADKLAKILAPLRLGQR